MEGSAHDRVAAEGGVRWERTDEVTLGVIRSRHPSVGGDTHVPQHLKILHLYCCVSCPTLQDIALSSTSTVISQTAH